MHIVFLESVTEMINYSKTSKQDIENNNHENLAEDKRSENRMYFKRAIAEAIEKRMSEQKEG